jgi:hypothetical protein
VCRVLGLGQETGRGIGDAQASLALHCTTCKASTGILHFYYGRSLDR